jgi:hypothetical protein
VAVEQHQHQCLANHKAVALNVEYEEGKKPRRIAKGAGFLKRGPRPLTAVLAAGLAVALLLLLLAGGRAGVPKVRILYRQQWQVNVAVTSSLCMCTMLDGPGRFSWLHQGVVAEHACKLQTGSNVLPGSYAATCNTGSVSAPS